MSDANKALIRLWGEEGFNKNNMAVADKVYAADVFYHEPTAGEVLGLEPLKQFVVTWRTAFPDARCRIDEWVAEGDRLAVRWALWGTHKGDFRGLSPTGRSVEFTAMYFYRFDGGKVVEIHAMVNILKILQQLGAVPLLKQVKN